MKRIVVISMSAAVIAAVIFHFNQSASNAMAYEDTAEAATLDAITRLEQQMVIMDEKLDRLLLTPLPPKETPAPAPVPRISGVQRTGDIEAGSTADRKLNEINRKLDDINRAVYDLRNEMHRFR